MLFCRNRSVGSSSIFCVDEIPAASPVVSSQSFLSSRQLPQPGFLPKNTLAGPCRRPPFQICPHSPIALVPDSLPITRMIVLHDSGESTENFRWMPFVLVFALHLQFGSSLTSNLFPSIWVGGGEALFNPPMLLDSVLTWAQLAFPPRS
jgi:hypothetical protein